ncbi:hypothetical protein YQE_10895, partial [Dendroctonus ponderosae]
MEQNNGAGDSCAGGLDRSKLIVNYIPQFATEEDLAMIFAPLGSIENIKIMRDFKTGYSYGFGFVKYFNEEDAAKAINLLNGFSFRNKRLKVSYSRPPGTDMKDSNLYITNLPKDVTEQDVENLFKHYGEIVQRTVLKDKHTGLPRGVAFVLQRRGGASGHRPPGRQNAGQCRAAAERPGGRGPRQAEGAVFGGVEPAGRRNRCQGYFTQVGFRAGLDGLVQWLDNGARKYIHK